MSALHFRRETFQLWKDGGVVDANFTGTASFQKQKTYEPIDRARVFAIDTESLTCKSQLTTLITTLRFHDEDALVETPTGTGMLHEALERIFARPGFAEIERAPSERKQRPRRTDPSGRSVGPRPGRRVKTEPVLSVWFNMPYDLGRLFTDNRHALRSLASGADSYRIRISEKYEIEVVRMCFGSSSSFEWYVRSFREEPDPTSESGVKRVPLIVRMLGLDLTGYWKSSLAAAAKATGVAAKDDIEAKIEGVYEKPREEFTPEEWEMFRAYAAGDTVTTLELYHRTVDLLVAIDARVVRKTGVIPPSAPGAAARIVFAKAFDCHPEIESWERYPAWADQMGAEAYFGGRAFCVKPGLHARMATLDLKSAYPFQMALLPDPVTVEMVPVEPDEFRGAEGQAYFVKLFREKYGVLYVTGESFDDVMPAFRVHDAARSGRLRYVAGKFWDVPVTIPELVIGILRGAIRVDAVSRGVVMLGSPETSFLRKGIGDFFAIKEDKTKEKSLRDLAKLLANSTYGKLIEVRKGEYLVGGLLPMRPFKERAAVASSLARVFASSGEVRREECYWGEGEAQETRAWEEFQKAKAYEGPSGFARRPEAAIGAYVDALDAADVEALPGPVVPVAEYVRKHKEYSCGHYFMPLYGAQITGATSAMVGLMAHCTGALQGDTDSVQSVLPERIEKIAEFPGIARYFAIMKDAGYPSPYVVDGVTYGGIPGMGKLGIWEEECDEPSVESILVRPKLYSHRFVDEGKGENFKQAKHGFAKFHSPDVESRLKDTSIPREQRTKEAGKARQAGLHAAMRELHASGTYAYATRRSPRRLKEAVRTNSEVGEFTSREMIMVTSRDPNTWLDPNGIVRWLPEGVSRESLENPPKEPETVQSPPPDSATAPREEREGIYGTIAPAHGTIVTEAGSGCPSGAGHGQMTRDESRF